MSAVNEVPAAKFNEGISLFQNHIVESDNRQFYRHNYNDYLAKKFYNQRHHRRFRLLGKVTKFGQRNEFSDNKMSTNRSEMGKPDKVNTKVASSRTRSKTTALKKASSGSDRTDNNE